MPPQRVMTGSRATTLLASFVALGGMIIWWNNGSTTIIGNYGTVENHRNSQTPSFQMVPSEGNGDCLFISIAVSLYYTQYNKILQYGSKKRKQWAKNLRIRANNVLCSKNSRTGLVEPSNEPLTKDGVPRSLLVEPLNGETGSDYCKRLRSSGQWGSAAEIMALSHSLNRPITVHTRRRRTSNENGVDDAYPILQRFGIREDNNEENAVDSDQTLHILYSGNNHYDALVVPLMVSKQTLQPSKL